MDRRIFGQFIEHLGRCIYGGIYDEGSALQLYKLLASSAAVQPGVDSYNDYVSSDYDVLITPILSDANKTFAFEYYTDVPTFHLPDLAWEVGHFFELISWGDLDLEVTFATGITVNSKPGATFAADGPGSVMTLICIAEGEWDLNGNVGV